MFGSLKGYKTYITGTIGILTAVGAYLAGDIELGSTLQAVLTSVLGMTIRHGIANQA